MRAVPTLQPAPVGGSLQQQVDWLMMMVQQILQATQDDPETIADSYKVEGLSFPTRDLDANAATPEQVRVVLATFLSDWRARGVSRGTG